jgi:hypothetical protein
MNNPLTQTSKHIQGCHNPQWSYIIHNAQENDSLKNNDLKKNQESLLV